MKENIIIYFVVICTLIFLLLTFFISLLVYRYKKNQKNHHDDINNLKALFENEKLKAQIQVQEATFQFISREIHDNVGQKLSLAKLQLNTLLESENQIVQNIIQILTDSLNDLRDLSRSMSAEFITNNGFVKTLENEIEQLNRTGRFNLKLIIVGDPIFLNGDKDIFLFRMVQEGLNNIIKHAEATQIEVKLHYQLKKLEIEITDNGKGFDVQKMVDSNGIKNIMSRVKLLKGTASIDSTIGKGTILKIKIPLYDTE